MPLFGLVLVAALAAFGWLNAVPLPLPRLLLPAAAFLAYGAAGLTAARAAHPASPVALVWTVAVLARLALLPLAPELSDDIYRYLWDGHLLAQGVNPYAHAPADALLAPLRTPWHGEINHPEVPTIYPPLAQLLFGATALLGGPFAAEGGAGGAGFGATAALAGGPIVAAKLVWLGFDVGCGLLLHRIARRTGRSPVPVLVWYLWSPLLIVETAWSAHFDSVGLFLLAALILAAGRRGGGRGGGHEPGRAPLAGAPPCRRHAGQVRTRRRPSRRRPPPRPGVAPRIRRRLRRLLPPIRGRRRLRAESAPSNQSTFPSSPKDCAPTPATGRPTKARSR